jgi:RNA polymerase sigma factor (TIGR02999 family)
MNSTELDITSLLSAWRNGDCEARDQLMEKIYPLMRDMARSRLRRSPQDITLDATDLANEAYTRLDGIRTLDWQSRAHFMAVSARAIRNIVVDHLRARSSDKRGGDLPFVSVEELDLDSGPVAINLDYDWLSVHVALDELETIDKSSAEVVELKFFSGLTTDEIAEAIGISRATVVRQWRFARAWMANRLNPERIGMDS